MNCNALPARCENLLPHQTFDYVPMDISLHSTHISTFTGLGESQRVSQLNPILTQVKAVDESCPKLAWHAFVQPSATVLKPLEATWSV